MKRNVLDMTEGKTWKTWEWAGEVEVSTPLAAGTNSSPLRLKEASLVALVGAFQAVLEEAFLAVVAVGSSFIFDW